MNELESANEPESLPDAVVEGESATPVPVQDVAAPETDPEKQDRQTRNWRALEKDRDTWREMAMRQRPPEPTERVPEPEQTAAKTLADFEYDEPKYQKYLFSEATKVATEAARRELENDRQRQDSERRTKTFEQKEREFAKANPDYFETALGRNPAIDVSRASPVVREAILESDMAPDLTFYLGKNPDVWERISALPPGKAASEIGRIETRLEAERERAKEAKRAVSKAPPPTPSLDAADAAPAVKTTDASGDRLSDAEWMALEAKRTRRK